VILLIQTKEDGYNSGRLYVNMLKSTEAQDWLDLLHLHTRNAVQQHDRQEMEEEFGSSRLSLARAKARRFFNSTPFQCMTAFFICGGFLCDIFEAQYTSVREGNSWLSPIFYWIEVSLTLIFTCELLLNLFAHSDNCFRPFFANGSNLLDTCIVMSSLLALTSWVPGLPNTKSFRLLRVGRVLRLLKGHKDLNKILEALSHSVGPVSNACLILLVISCVYAVLGTEIFGQKHPELFGRFQVHIPCAHVCSPPHS
jgi:hypothetical protein